MKSIKDIAMLAKVSTGTVDRVIHGRKGVSQKTKSLIESLIAEHGIQINETGRSLAMTNKIKLATLMPKSQGELQFWHYPLEGVLKAAALLKASGTNVENFFFDQQNPNSFLKALQDIINTAPTGLLVAPLFHTEMQKGAKQLEDAKIPYLFMNVDIEQLHPISFIGQHAFKSGQTAGFLMQSIGINIDTCLIIKVNVNATEHLAIEDRIKGFQSILNESKIPSKILFLDLKQDDKIIRNQIAKFTENSKKKLQYLFIPNSKGAVIAHHVEAVLGHGFRMIGYDGTAKNILALKNKQIDFIIDQKPINQGYLGLVELNNYLLNKKELKRHYYSDINILTRFNS